jgi:hypothetical protein
MTACGMTTGRATRVTGYGGTQAKNRWIVMPQAVMHIGDSPS